MKSGNEEDGRRGGRAKRTAGASVFDCYYGNVSAKPNSALRQTETRKRKAKITNVKGLNVLNVHNCPAPEYLTPDPSRRMDSDRQTDRQLLLLSVSSNLLGIKPVGICPQTVPRAGEMFSVPSLLLFSFFTTLCLKYCLRVFGPA